jgi:hypothetical protein
MIFEPFSAYCLLDKKKRAEALTRKYFFVIFERIWVIRKRREHSRRRRDFFLVLFLRMIEMMKRTL